MKNTTKLLSIILVLGMILGVFMALGITASAAPGTGNYDVNGDGTNETAYQIYTADDLLWFAQQVNGGNSQINGVLMNDIDLSTVCSATLGNWTPIGSASASFKGSFDGRGFTVENLYYNDPAGEYVGLFGHIQHPSIIRNVKVTGTIIASQVIGGVVAKGIGYTNGKVPEIHNCVNYVNIHATKRDAGGILGVSSGHIYGCVNYGNISVDSYYSGGIIGFGYDNTIKDCLNFGQISGTKSFGLGHMNQASCKISNFVNLGSADTDGVSDKGVTNCFSVSDTSVSGATKIDANDARIASGELAYMLGEGWGQKIGVDATPVPGGMKVYYTIDPATLCNAATPTYYYANSENTKRTHDANMPAENYDNGFCTICGGYQPATDSDGDGLVEVGNAGQLYWAAQFTKDNTYTKFGFELTANIVDNENLLAADGTLSRDPSTLRHWIGADISDNINGNGYTISGLYQTGNNVGLVGRSNDRGGGSCYVTISNLGIIDSYFDNSKNYAVGSFVGYASGQSMTLENCYSTATIAGGNWLAGGLVGASNSRSGVKMINCYYAGVSLIPQKTLGIAGSNFRWQDGSANNYCVTGNKTTEGTEISHVTGFSRGMLASGELAHILGGAYGQNLDNGGTVQTYPVISDAKVYYGYTTCDEAQTAPIYTNNSAASATKPEHTSFGYTVSSIANGNVITKTCGVCGNEEGSVTIYATGGTYNLLAKKAVVTGEGEFAGKSFVITYTDAEGNSTTTAPTEIGKYTASITVEGNTVSVDFEIFKGVMNITTSPTATHEFGDTHEGKPISGEVAMSGNEAVKITGTWTWVEGTTKAIFTPDAQYVDLFEGIAPQYVSIIVTAGSPTLTLTTPSPSIMPGMSIRMSVAAQNKYNAEITDLPTSFRVTYKIGENGTPTTVNGLEFTLPSNATLGDVVYVTVENVAVSGKYSVATSNTVELIVGQVNYTEDIERVQENLDKAIEQLNAAITAGDSSLEAEINNLKAAMTEAQNAIVALQNDYATKAEVEALENTLKQADNEIIDAYTKAIADAKAELQALIDTKASKDELEAAKTTLEGLIENAVRAAEESNAALKTELVGIIEDAIYILTAADERLQANIDAAIKKAAEELEAVRADLQAKLDANDQRITDEVNTLNETIEKTKKLLEDADAKNRAELEAALAEAVATLNAADEQLQANIDAAIKKAAEELEAVRADLQAKLDANDQRITDEVNTLNETIEKTKKLLEEADAKNRAELEAALAEAVATLNAAIDQLRADLEAARADLQSKIDANTELIETEVDRLDELVATTREILEAADRKNREELEAALEDARTTLQKAIDKVSSRLTSTQKVLLNVIDAGDKQLDTKINQLNAALTEALALLDTKTVEADAALKAELIAKIEAADKALDEAVKAVQKNLDDAKAELSGAITDGDAALMEKLSALEAALKSAEAALKSADDANKLALTQAIEKAKSDLTKLITEGDKQNADALAAAMTLLRAETEQAKKDAQLVPTILVIIALAGDVVLAAWIIISKKKRV